MPRPEKARTVAAPPLFADFKPSRVPKRLLETIDLSLDEFEAIRLSDYLGLDHSEAAERMDVSRPTFTRLHDRARNKIAQFIIEGKNLLIGGGTVHFRENRFRCDACGKTFLGPLGTERSPCPACASRSTDDLAAMHGHGRCCMKESKNRE